MINSGGATVMLSPKSYHHRYMTPVQIFRERSPTTFDRFLAMGSHQSRPRPLSREK